ncbi:MraY family glycosyltransferase [Lysobacter humi (ex Lee et al. 2017)]
MLEHAAAVAVITAVGTWLARQYALRRALIDEPGERRSHAQATPRGGGIGPVVALLLALLLGAQFPLSFAIPAALGLVLVASIGWWDDHRPLSASLRLLVHVVAGVLLAVALDLWRELPVAAVAVVLGTAALVNIWNFMDGINGIATLQAAAVGATALVLIGSGTGTYAGLIVAACLAFLPFNFPRARIFLGDVGSGALGYLMALVAAPRAVNDATPLLLFFPMAPFAVDAGLTLLRRMVRGERWWTPHTQHLYQVAARRLAHAPVTLAYTGVAAAGGLIAWRLRAAGMPVTMASLAVWYTACALAWAVLQYVAAGRGAPTEKDR